MAKSKFPNEILVTVADEGEEEFLVIHRDVKSVAEPGERVPTAKYRLVEVGAVISAPEFVKR